MQYGRSRYDSYTFALVDPWTLCETGEIIETVEDTGNITWGSGTDNRVSASITVYGAYSGTNLIRIKHLVRVDEEEEFETLGTFFNDGSSADAIMGNVTMKLDCYSTLYRFTQDVLETDFSRPVGTVVVDEVRDLVEGNDGLLRVLPGVDTSQTHTLPMWWEVGTNRASILESLAEWTNCVLDVDEDGYITWGPYVEPMLRPLSYTFENGLNCVYLDGITIEDTHADAVNRVVAHFSRQSKNDDDTLPLSDSVYVDLPESHPYSYRVIGRHKTYDLKVSDPCSHEDLTAQAQRYLDEHSGSTTYYEIQHVGVTGLRPGQRVRYINRSDTGSYIDTFCIVEEVSMDLGKNCLCDTKLRVI